MALSGVAGTFVCGVTLYDGAANIVKNRLPEIGTHEVLVTLLTGVNFHRNIAGQFLAQGLIQAQNCLRRDLSGKINFCFHKRFPPFFNISFIISYPI